jgi:hypothetical protein
MAGILGNSSLTDKTAQIAAAVSGEEAPKSGIPDEAILLKDFKLRGIPAEVGISGALAELKAGLKMYRQSNTIIAIKKLNPVTAQVHFFTMDREAEFQQLIKFWIDKLRELNCQVIYDTALDPHIIRGLQAAGATIQPSDIPQFKLKASL